ncbi:class I SAM-dependent methyltransferase [Marinoscillum furvescens]|uniref:Methyltransferase family protein n=1 Tax=Marinoscillum furvescens DSM 4134 TaxID=1122208 RepID=A0A3D9L0H9_MARFU|nr:class I SAM-dependent methyltransferase [Marinoscillum furvescens]RED96956.1 methyltransferase family protein [Marinoscillum furvescens DSM 4134]
MTPSRKDHWENVYTKKSDQEVSWYEEVPVQSLGLITELAGPDAHIIDVGGGNSNLVGELLLRGYQQLTVLDISAAALERTRQKLGTRASNVVWEVADVTSYVPDQTFDVWHDRATFHFLTDEADQKSYLELVQRAIKPGGYLVLATFATSGPEKCSGLEICQYDTPGLEAFFGEHFEVVQAFENTHETPFGTSQNFIYAVLRKR